MNKRFISQAAFLTTIACTLLTASAWAQTQGGASQDQGGQGSGEHRHGPPPEAIAACQGKASGATCSFVGRQGEQLTGTCFTPPPRQSSSAPQSGNSGDQSVRPMACRPPRKEN
jgi:hypothetical protein